MRDDMQSERNYNLISLVDLATRQDPSEESVAADFAVQLLTILGYIQRPRVARSRKDITLFICGEWKHAKINVCLIDRQQNNVLLLQEEKRLMNHTNDAQHQLVAGAIAAVQQRFADTRAGEPAIESQNIPGIVLLGTAPIFYTNSRHEELGAYPPEQTVVLALVPPLPNPRHRYSEGMKPLDNRNEILRNYEAV